MVQQGTPEPLGSRREEVSKSKRYQEMAPELLAVGVALAGWAYSLRPGSVGTEPGGEETTAGV